MGIAASGNQVAFPMTGHGSVRHLRGEICQVYLCIVLDMYSGVVTPGSGGVDGRCSGRAARRSFSTRIIGGVPTVPAAHRITCSMSAVGSCADNAAAESLFGVLKRNR